MGPANLHLTSSHMTWMLVVLGPHFGTTFLEYDIRLCVYRHDSKVNLLSYIFSCRLFGLLLPLLSRVEHSIAVCLTM